jgi:hypothetical protein
MRLLHIFAAHVERPWRTRLSFLRRLLPRTGTDSFDPSIYGFILHYSRPEQIYLVIITIFSFPFLYISLQLPKYIVNTITSKASLKELFGLDIALFWLLS